MSENFGTILVVATNPDLRGLLTSFLGDAFPAAVIPCRNEHEGYRRALTQMPKLILMDIPANPATELELIRRLRLDGMTRHCPIIGLVDSHEHCKRALRAGCTACLYKPGVLEQLEAMVKAHLDIA